MSKSPSAAEDEPSLALHNRAMLATYSGTPLNLDQGAGIQDGERAMECDATAGS